MNVIADYDATHANVRLTEDGQEAMLLFLLRDGNGSWVSVTLDRAGLEAIRDRILEGLSQPVPRAPRR